MDNILLTIDVEDWFQVENFKQWISFSSWPTRELRVEKNTHRLLDLFDSLILTKHNDAPVSQGSISPKATFFVLAWLAERLPNLVREIQNRGHEVASHGYYHNLCNRQSVEDFKKDLIDSKKLLEDITGVPVYGYRAPSFAINNEVLKIIEDCGYLYDSSYNSFALHGRYGQVDFSQNDRKGIAIQISKTDHATSTKSSIINHQSSIFFELPISNLKFKIQNSKLKNSELPWGGGGYFRLIPLFIFKMGIKAILKKENDYLFYMHPWEVDPEQPRVDEASFFYKFRHYVNLDKTAYKLTRMIQSFSDCRYVTCAEYLNTITEG